MRAIKSARYLAGFFATESMAPPMSHKTQSTILALVASRPDGTTCPSEIARSLAKAQNSPLQWRKFMPVVHDAVDALIERGEITLTWKSAVMSERAGPYRISGRKQKD